MKHWWDAALTNPDSLNKSLGLRLKAAATNEHRYKKYFLNESDNLRTEQVEVSDIKKH